MKRRYVGIGILVAFVLALLWWGLRPEKDEPLKASATISKPAMAAPRPPATRPAPNFPSAVAIAPAPLASANATSREPNNLGQVNLGIAPQKFVLKSGRLLVVSIVQGRDGGYTLNLGVYRAGSTGRGIPLHSVGIRLRTEQTVEKDLGEGDIVTLDPIVVPDANDLGVVHLVENPGDLFPLSSGQIVTIQLDTTQTPDADPKYKSFLIVVYNSGQPIDGRGITRTSAGGTSGDPISIRLSTGEYIRFTPKF